MKKVFLLGLFILSSYTLFAQAQSGLPAPPPPISTIQPNSISAAPVQASKASIIRQKGNALATNSIMDNMATMENFSKFFKVVELAGLIETFRSAGPITIFIPDNDAFDKMPKGKLDTLLRADHRPELIAFITYHAIPGKFNAQKIAKQAITHKNSATFTTLSGSKLYAKVDAAKTLTLTDETGRESTITQSDMKQSNGMLFTISEVLITKNKVL